MLFSSDIIAVSISARTSAGYYLGAVSGCSLVCWYDLGYVLGLVQAFPVISAVSVIGLQTSAGFLSEFPAVSVVCLPAPAP